jgi:hypothetical protein
LRICSGAVGHDTLPRKNLQHTNFKHSECRRQASQLREVYAETHRNTGEKLIFAVSLSRNRKLGEFTKMEEKLLTGYLPSVTMTPFVMLVSGVYRRSEAVESRRVQA